MRLGAPRWALTDVGEKPTTSSGVRRAATTPHLAGWFENRMIYIIVAPCPLFATTALLSQFGQCERFERRTLRALWVGGPRPVPRNRNSCGLSIRLRGVQETVCGTGIAFQHTAALPKISRGPTQKTLSKTRARVGASCKSGLWSQFERTAESSGARKRDGWAPRSRALRQAYGAKTMARLPESFRRHLEVQDLVVGSEGSRRLEKRGA